MPTTHQAMTDQQLLDVQVALWTARDDARNLAGLPIPEAAEYAKRECQYQAALEIVTEARGYPPREVVEDS